MATVVREERSNNSAVWIAIVVIALLAIGVIAVLMANGNDDVELDTVTPAAVVTDMGSAAADSAAVAADAAQNAAASAADFANQAAQSVNSATQNAADQITATVPGPGDSSVTVTTPAR